ncbi:MAG: maltose alpha-D-glucosyltransferase [Deltaproteobacteria bacterium]|nr:maltose alpha-D-glucosyltransferase [Deltaproteobacteria bacterium]
MATSAGTSTGTDRNLLWFKDAVLYQLHVKSFFDSDGDGVGDFNGLSQKLDYLQELGVSTLWLMPFCRSPLRDDGYDISDYRAIHPAYGTLKDFRAFLKQAHQRGLRVITELILNHTSDQHPWFQRARRSKAGSPWRDWYVWSDTPQRFTEARVIFQDFESSNWTWDPVAGAYFWHRFYSHQPDLNYDNPAVRKAIHDIVEFWFRLGVDGLRLDAVPYLFERDGTNCENLPESHQFLKELRAHADAKFQGRILLAEANQWPEDAVAYFGEGDECHMAFHFPLMPRLFMAVHMEDSFPIRDILQQTPAIPETCQWAIFLRNHDELTLEMVTDEERDYMYRVYAQDPRMRINLGIRRRLFPLLGNHRRRTELVNALLFSLPGTPIIYYGDEIGMGDNVYLGDRDGVRTPMQWSTDRNAGFSHADPQKLFLPVIISPEYHCEVINVEVQENNPHSVLWWMRRLISLRNQFKAFSRGSIEALNPDNSRIFAFVRRFQDERLLVVANLSRFVQYADLDLAAYQGMVPVELFGKTAFPAIQSTPYFLSIGPHSFFWFYLTPGQAAVETVSKIPEAPALPVLEVDLDWRHSFPGKADRPALEEALSAFVTRSPWFASRARPLKRTRIHEVFPLIQGSRRWYLVLLKAEFLTGDAEIYTVPLTCADGPEAERLLAEHPAAAVATLKFKAGRGTCLLADASADPGFGEMMLQALFQRRHIPGKRSSLRATTTPAFRKLQAKNPAFPSSRIMPVEQRNTTLRFGDRFVLKFIRRPAPGINPALEIGRLLTEKGFPHCAPVDGALELQADNGELMTVAVLQDYVIHQGDAWSCALSHLRGFFESVRIRHAGEAPPELPPASPAALIKIPPPPEALESIGEFLELARLLGRRTAAMHACLASVTNRPEFEPEPFSKLYQRSLYQSMRTLTGRSLPLLRWQFNRLSEDARGLAADVLGREPAINERFKALLNSKITALRIRCHGDYQLQQALYTGSDFVIIGFEGNPARPITERCIKRSALWDVAGMLRSFHYVSHAALVEEENLTGGHVDEGLMRGWAEFWNRWVSAQFLTSYLLETTGSRLVPAGREELQLLLDTLLLECAVGELGHEIQHRPQWAKIPLTAIRELLSP